MTKIYGDACDKYVNAVVLYGDSGKLYMDADLEEVCKSEVCEDLFKKGLMKVETEDGLFAPVSMAKLDDGTAYVALSNAATYCSDDKVVPQE